MGQLGGTHQSRGPMDGSSHELAATRGHSMAQGQYPEGQGEGEGQEHEVIDGGILWLRLGGVQLA